MRRLDLKPDKKLRNPERHLRQLARNARAERDRNKPLHAYRELFRALREILDAH